MFSAIILFIVLTVVVSVGGFFFARFKKRFVLKRALDEVLFRVTLPKTFHQEEEQHKEPVKERIALMEQFYTAFSRMRDPNKIMGVMMGPPHITFELAVPAVGEDITFYMAAPSDYAHEAEKALHSIYSEASVERIEDYNIFHPYGVSSGAEITLSKDYALPLRTYQTLESDPLPGLATALSKLEVEGEGAAIQILIKPIARQKHAKGMHIAKQMQKTGHSFRKAKSELSFFGHVSGAFKNKEKEEKQRQASGYGQSMMPQLTPFLQETIKAVENKSSKLMFAANIRILTSGPTPAQAREILNHIIVALKQFEGPNFNSFKVKIAKRKGVFKKLVFNYSFRVFDKSKIAVLSTEELTSLYHFPNVPLETPKIKFLKAKPAPPPSNMPSEGIILGMNNYRGVKTMVRLGEDDRRRHLYVIGQTGTGKTSFMREMIKQDIEAGNGIGVVDPHGDLAEAALSFVPKNRADDVVYFDPADPERPPGLNMLEWDTPEQKDFAVQEMVRIFEKLFPPETIGPMFEHNMRNAMLTLMADKSLPGTIAEIPRVFTDDEFVKAYLAKVSDPIVRAFWEKEMAKTTEFHRSEMLGYLVSKVGRFVENTQMRNIIGQARSSFNLADIMNQGKIFIANLSKGKLGEVNASLLGLVLVGKMQMASMARAHMQEAERRDFYLYIDEFQNFITDSISAILSESRKYRLNLIIAHQFMGQLPEQIRDAVFGNVGSLTSFRVGPQDAEFLAKQFYPVFNEKDLVNIDNFNAYVKLMVKGITEKPFNLELTPPSYIDRERFEEMREVSRLRYGTPRQEVEEEILERSRLGFHASAEASMTPRERNA